MIALTSLRLHRPTPGILEVLGWLALVIGVGMIYLPAGVIIAGIGLLIASIGAPPDDLPDERDS